MVFFGLAGIRFAVLAGAALFAVLAEEVFFAFAAVLAAVFFVFFLALVRAVEPFFFVVAIGPLPSGVAAVS